MSENQKFSDVFRGYRNGWCLRDQGVYFSLQRRQIFHLQLLRKYPKGKTILLKETRGNITQKKIISLKHTFYVNP